MNEIDKLKMDRRRLEVEITRLQEKIDIKAEEKKEIDKRLIQLQQTGKAGNEFKTSLFG